MMRVDTAALEKAARCIRKNAGAALNGLALETAKYLACEATARTPVDTGLMKKSWVAAATGNLTAVAKNPTRYASFVEFGRRNRGGGAFLPGQKFMTTAIAETEQAMPEIAAAHLLSRIGGWFGD